MKNTYDNYYLGLDLGTSSIGWAVTNKDYEILKYRNKSLWGIRLFDEAEKAVERRVFRSSRRRFERKKHRILQLQNVFKEEISRIDNTFFLKLNNSSMHNEDKHIDLQKNLFTIFNDKDYTDKDYYKQYPTIFHLKKALLSGLVDDSRLLYLALHNYMKHRGHYLLSGEINKLEDIKLDELIEKIHNFLCENYNTSFILNSNSLEKLEYFFKYRKNKDTNESIFGVTNSKNYLIEITGADTKQKKQICNVLANGTINFKELYDKEELKDFKEIKKISDNEVADKIINCESTLQELTELLYILKEIYDYCMLKNICKDHNYISEAIVEKYETHKRHLQILKDNLIMEDKKNLLSYQPKINNYCSYIGYYIKNNQKIRIGEKCSYEDFLKYLKLIISKPIYNENSDIQSLMSEIENNSILPKQRCNDNSVIPYQINKLEIIQILKNCQDKFAFLQEVDSEYNITNLEKIIKIFEFKIPYYIGPLNPHSHFAWVKRIEKGKVTPWNFHQKIDENQSAIEFIQRMTNKCTYIIGEDVLPKNSLLYSEYLVLNELNNLKINNEKLDNDTKWDIYNKVFLTKNNIVFNDIIKYYNQQKGIKIKKEDISGIDEEFKSSLKPYMDFKRILVDYSKVKKYRKEIEEIIKWNTIFPEGNILQKQIKNSYGNIFTDTEINQMCRIKYSGWGALSERLLSGIKYKDNEGEYLSIIDIMRSRELNFMVIYWDKDYDFVSKVSEINNKVFAQDNKVTYKTIDNLYCSPAVKRQIWQNVLLLNELKKTLKNDPKKIFIEMPRGDKENSGRTVSRKYSIEKIYKLLKEEKSVFLKQEIDSLKSNITKANNNELKGKKLFLYYIQLGRCMYSNRRIDINNLSNYDIDHIYPQSKIKDDSFDNTVLVERKINDDKKDIYPLSNTIINSNKVFWNYLLKNGLITKEKYNRLTRKSSLSIEELGKFINRQLVETRQTTKVVSQIITMIFPNSKIVFPKANITSEFRDKFGLYKCRELNNLHHAKDAYLNIIAGNVYNTVFGYDARKFFKEKNITSFNIKYLYDKDRVGAWETDITINAVTSQYCKNDILISYKNYKVNGKFYDQTIYRKGGKDLIPRNNMLSDTSKYGGFKGQQTSYFICFTYEKKGKIEKRIDIMPTLYSDKYISTRDIEKYLCDLGYNNAKLIHKFNKNSIIRYDKTEYVITGHSGTSIIFNSIKPLLLSNNGQELIKLERYCKNIAKYKERYDKNKEYRAEYLFEKDKKGDKIAVFNEDSNLELYNILLEKLADKSLKGTNKFLNLYNCFVDYDFKALEIEIQLLVLFELIKAFNNTNEPNFDIINQSIGKGRIRPPKDITKHIIQIIDKSVTGLFTTKIRL